MNVAAAPHLAAVARDRLRAPTRRILEIQEKDGAIPWFEDGPWDPWNHVEAAMALSVMGEAEAADRAYSCLVERQRPDGAWLGEYGSALPIVDRLRISREPAPAFLDTNFTAYVATGVWHRLLVTGDLATARRMWPTVAAAMEFVLSLQGPEGDIAWSAEARDTSVDDSLLAGNACIAKSLECAIALADALGEDAVALKQGHTRLSRALAERPDRFDRRGDGARYAMDWYYPVLSGALDRVEARARLGAGAERFVDPEAGCRCVSDEPWHTVAETAELVLALAAIGERGQARLLFDTQFRITDAGGVFWMGWQTEERIFWPQEQPAWTQGAMVLAADALFELSPGARVLTHGAASAAEHAEASRGQSLLGRR